MPIAEQLADFNAFAAQLLRSDGGASDLTLEAIYDRWWEDRNRDEDLEAIRASVADYERGERGEDARAELTEHRARRAGGRAP